MAKRLRGMLQLEEELEWCKWMAMRGATSSTTPLSSTTVTGVEIEGRSLHVDVNVHVYTMDQKEEDDQQSVKIDREKEGQRPVEPVKKTSENPMTSPVAETTTPGVMEAPWESRRYGTALKSSTDVWDTSLLDGGWLVRQHRKERKRLFHPVHGSLPIPESALGVERTTVRFVNGNRVVKHDDWRGAVRLPDGEPWRGFTFFRVNMKNHHDNGGGYGSAGGVTAERNAPCEEEIFDGSFEKVMN